MRRALPRKIDAFGIFPGRSSSFGILLAWLGSSGSIHVTSSPGGNSNASWNLAWKSDRISEEQILCDLPVSPFAFFQKLSNSDTNSYAAHLGLKVTPIESLAMYEMLGSMEVYTSHSICKTVSIEQGLETITVQQGTAYLHIEEHEHALSIYIPKSQNRRQVCLAAYLPIALLKHFDVPNFKLGSGLGNIITAPKLSMVDDLLKFAGIIEVQGIVRPDVEEFSDEESCVSEDETLIADEGFAEDRPASHGRTVHSSSSHSRTNLPIRSAPNFSFGTTIPPAAIFNTASVTLERNSSYKLLLEAITAQAEMIKSDDMPEKGSYAVVVVPTPLGLDTSFAVGSDIIGEREFKIGVAGELFVSLITNWTISTHLTCGRFSIISNQYFLDSTIHVGKAQSATGFPFTISIMTFLAGLEERLQILFTRTATAS